MYRIIIDRRVSQQIEDLPKKIIQKIIKVIEDLQFNPRPVGVKKLIGNVGWRVRVADYRILYTIDDAQGIVIIYRVKHRRDVYR